MNKNVLIFCLIFFTVLQINSQTNTFPTSGNVGIGTSSPSTNLHLKGSSDGLFTLQTTDNSWLYTSWLDNTSTRRIWMGLGSDLSSFNISAENGTSKILFNGGNVGIGTTNPSSKLHVFNNTNQNGLNIENSSSSMTNYGLMVNNTSTTNGYLLRLRSSAVDKVTVTGIGNVGIGTTTPSEKLEIFDNIDGSVYIGVNNLASGANSTSGIKLGFGTTPYDKGTSLYHRASDNTFYFSNTGDPNSKFSFITRNSVGSSLEALRINPDGNVGIGTTTPDAKLTVKGNIHTQEVKVDLLGAVAPDYVFYKDYDLKTLNEVESYISAKGHLPNIPSAKEMEADGIYLKDMNLKLLEKIEELTLYTIEQEKEIKTSKNELQNQKVINKKVEDKFKIQENRLQKIEALLNSIKQ